MLLGIFGYHWLNEYSELPKSIALRYYIISETLDGFMPFFRHAPCPFRSLSAISSLWDRLLLQFPFAVLAWHYLGSPG